MNRPNLFRDSSSRAFVQRKTHNLCRLRLKGTFPGAEEFDIEAVETEQISTLGKLKHTSFAHELWKKGYHLADDRFLSGKAEPCEMGILIEVNQQWKEFITHAGGLRAQKSKLR